MMLHRRTRPADADDDAAGDHETYDDEGRPSGSPSSLPSVSRLSSNSSLSSLGREEEVEEKKKFDCDAYADKRAMTPLQEKANAITILPSALMCLHYVLSGRWISREAIEEAAVRAGTTADDYDAASSAAGCIQSDLFPNLPSLPPPTILAIALGIILHCPCSFLYHWAYAANQATVAGVDRFGHWSRRLDHCAIHLCSALWSYGTSAGSLPYFGLNVLYNADCIRCHLQPVVVPIRNQIRLLLSVALYTAPLLFGDGPGGREDGGGGGVAVFVNFWLIFAVAIWLFAAYPLGGWSHAAFHVVMVFMPPLLLDYAAEMEAGGDWVRTAAKCAVLSSGMRGSA